MTLATKLYSIGRIKDECFDPLLLTTTGIFTKNAIESYSAGTATGFLGGLLCSYVIFRAGVPAIPFTSGRLRYYKHILEIAANKTKYPLEHAQRVQITDLSGLSQLLSRTNAYEKNEWGTFLHATEKDGIATIDKLFSDEEMQENKLILRAGKEMILANDDEAKNLGLNGFHHYHPSGGTMNYSLNYADKSRPKNWINLLTFNLPNGPEIIAFNHRHIYIPDDSKKSLKTELVRATPKDIKRYLERMNL